MSSDIADFGLGAGRGVHGFSRSNQLLRLRCGRIEIYPGHSPDAAGLHAGRRTALTRAMCAERAVFRTAGSMPLPRLEFTNGKRRFTAEVVGFTRRIEFRRAVRAGAFAHTAANAFFLIPELHPQGRGE